MLNLIYKCQFDSFVLEMNPCKVSTNLHTQPETGKNTCPGANLALCTRATCEVPNATGSAPAATRSHPSGTWNLQFVCENRLNGEERCFSENSWLSQ